ncbi:MAG: TolC family protein [Elusimicrobia bacterium]|nr:TolC family protein [Elusimicrobiota bacterium]
MNVLRGYPAGLALPCLCLALLSSRGFGAPLTLPEYLAQVDAANPVIQAARAHASAGASRVRPAATLDDPFVAVGVDQVPLSGPDMSSVMRYQLSQSLPFPGKLSAQRRAAEGRARSSELDSRTVRRRTLVQAKYLFLKMYYNEQALQWNARLGRLFDDLTESAKIRYKTGGTVHHEWLLAKLESSTLAVERLKLGRKRKTLTALLNELRDVPADETIDIAPVEFSTAAVAAAPLADQPELRALGASIEAADQERRRARLSYFPDFVVQGMAMRPRAAGMGGSGNWGAMLGINLPLFFYRKQAGLVAAADSRRTAAAAEENAIKNRLAAELVEATEQLRTARDILALYEKEIIPVTQIAAKNAESSYATKQGPLSQFIEALKVQRTQDLELTAARIDLEVARTRIQELLSAPPLLRLTPGRPTLLGGGMDAAGMGVSGTVDMGRGMSGPTRKASSPSAVPPSSGMGGM